MTEERTQPALWEQQFDVSFDFPPAAVTTKYVICTSPRCGSHHLGHLLHQAGGFGYPLEYMNAANLRVWARRAREAGVVAPLAYIKRVRTDRNGVFGIKVHYSHLHTFLQNEDDVLRYRFITLERRDLLKQAVSYSWAAQTKSWISGMPSVDTAVYDWESIATKLTEIVRSNAGWRSFLAGAGITPLQLIHEDVRTNPEAAVDQVAAFLGVTPLRGQPARRFAPAEQKESGKDEWVRQFIDDTRQRLGRREFPVGGPVRPETWLAKVPSLFRRFR